MKPEDVAEEARRDVVERCGRLALAALPALARLLTATDRGDAIVGPVEGDFPAAKHRNVL